MPNQIAFYPQSSGGGGGFTQIGTTQVVSGTPASITFSSIPQTFSHLRLYVQGKAGTTQGNIVINYNGDTAANYHSLGTSMLNASVSALQTFNTATPNIGYISGTDGDSTSEGTMVIDIPFYSSTAWPKGASSSSICIDTGSNSLMANINVAWKSAAAITSIVLTVSGGTNFVAGTRAALYGL